MKSGEATRLRILAAAKAEFAQYGIAGARVDRISSAAQANKAQLYAWFGSKDELFETVFQQALHGIMDAVPIDATDLADWAVRLYDDYLVHPEMVRLAAWARLERNPTGHLVPDPERLDTGKLAAIAQAQRSGLIDPDLEPFEVLVMVIAMSMTWSPVSTTYTATATESEAEHDRRRTVLAGLVRRAFAPPPGISAGHPSE